MKKNLIIILLLFFITGCGNKTEDYKVEVDFDQDYYEVYTPYKEGVATSYIVNNVFNNYDKDNIESSLMALSSNYFRTNNSFYEEGQYLNNSDLKTLLSNDYLNKTSNINIDGIDITPTYISSIYEQDYLASNGNLRGISLAIVLNPYQSYKNSYGSYLYKKVDDNTIIQYGKDMSKKLVEYLYNDKKLDGTRLVIGLYVLPEPNTINKGSFVQIAVTTKKEFSFEELNYQYNMLDSSYVIENDVNTYNAYTNLKKSLNNVSSDLYISGDALYQGGLLKDIKIYVNSDNYTKSKLLYLSKMISEEIANNFNSSVNIRVYLQSNSGVLALVTKDKNTNKSNVTLIGE